MILRKASKPAGAYPTKQLFDRLLREMDSLTAEHSKVFLATLTVSHHRPFDFPEGVVPFPAEERRSEYAGVR